MLNSADMAQYIGHYPPDNLEYGATFSQYGRVEQAIEDLYGPRGARAILLRAGRRSFQHGLKERPAAFGLAREGSESMPGASMEAKMGRLLRQMVAAGSETMKLQAHLEEDADSFVLAVSQCACEYRPRHQQPCCLVPVGVFAESVHWLTDKRVDVTEIACLNLGADACRFRVPKRPSG